MSDECPAISNPITPNGDEVNDAFVALGVEEITLKLNIFNRWGKPVYQTDRYDNNLSALDRPAGIYFYRFTSNRTF